MVGVVWLEHFKILLLQCQSQEDSLAEATGLWHHSLDKAAGNRRFNQIFTEIAISLEHLMSSKQYFLSDVCIFMLSFSLYIYWVPMFIFFFKFPHKWSSSLNSLWTHTHTHTHTHHTHTHTHTTHTHTHRCWANRFSFSWLVYMWYACSVTLMNRTYETLSGRFELSWQRHSFPLHSRRTCKYY